MKNKKITEKNILIIFLLLGPFLDVASFLGSSLSLLLRGLFLALITVLLIVRKKDLKLVLPLLLFASISFLYQSIYLKAGIVSSISSIMKFLYLPVSVIYFKNLETIKDKDKLLTIILFTYLGIYLFSYITKTGANAYLETDGKSGFKGLFASINEFSAIVIGLLPIVGTYLKEKKKYILLVLILVGTLISSLLIGTKVLLGGLLFTILYLLFQERESLFLKRNKTVKIGIVVGIIILIVLGGFLFTKTRTYQNMKIQQEFFKVENVLSLDFVNRVVYNNRLTFLKDNFDYMKSQNVFFWILGIGLQNSLKLVEIDIFDIFVRYGILGIAIFLGITISKIKWQDLRNQDKVSLILLLIASLTSGHVLFYPAVSIYFGVIIIKNGRSSKQCKQQLSS